MKKIKYIIPYFGKLPFIFKFWLITCEKNPTIEWLIFTDDKTFYNYPSNVQVVYCTFEYVKNKIQDIFDFQINLNTPRKLCDFKVTYGEAFKEYLTDVDFWGYCDIDLVWGDIRKFITDDILNNYLKIGFQGHSTLYKNTYENNNIFRKEFSDLPSFKEVFSSDKGYCYDETVITEIFNRLNIKSYLDTNFIHFSKYDYGLVAEHFPKEDSYKNNNQVFIWDNGKIYRKYIYNHKVYTEEYMYMHFFCRPIFFKTKAFDSNQKYIFYSDVIDELNNEVDCKYIFKHSKKSKIKYYFKSLWCNRNKITIKKIIFNIKTMIRYKKRIRNGKEK